MGLFSASVTSFSTTSGSVSLLAVGQTCTAPHPHPPPQEMVCFFLNMLMNNPPASFTFLLRYHFPSDAPTLNLTLDHPISTGV